MRILLCGDTHGNTKHMRYLLDTAQEKNCDCIFQLGDFGYWEHEPSGVLYLDEINKHARLHDIPIYFLDGNHDKTSLVLEKYGDRQNSEGFLVCRPHVRYAPRGHRWAWEGKKFIALGGARSIDPDKNWRLAQEEKDSEARGEDRSGTIWFPEEEMSDEDMDDILLADPMLVDVMLTHDKPRSSKPMWNRKDLPECWPNQDRIQRAMETLKPKLLVHGHLHHRYEDTVTHNDGATEDFTKVIGLDADPWTAGRFYRVENSWEVLEIP